MLEHLSQVVLADPAYRAADGGPSTVHLVRTYRPVWALVTGSVGSLAFGAGLLLFLVKRTERCSVMVHDGPTGTVVTLSGRLAAARAKAMRAALAEPPPARDPLDDGHPAESLVAVGSATPSPSTTPPPAHLEAIGMPLLPPDEPGTWATGARTLVISSRDESPKGEHDGASRLIARFDDGTSIELSGFTLLGREPRGLPEESEAALVPLLDPTLTVSKTHLSIRPVPGGAEIADRASSNGTTVISGGGQERSLVAGQPVLIAPGSRVRLGDRIFDLVAV